MSTEAQPEGNLSANGEQEAKPASSGGNGQPSATEISELIKRLDALEHQTSSLQSVKDKAVDRYKKEVVEPLQDSFAKFAKYLNVDPETATKAQRAMVMDEIVNERLNGFQTAKSPDGTVRSAVNPVDTAAILKKVGIDENSPEAIQFMRSQFDNPDQAELEAYRMKNRPQPSPTPETKSALKGNPPRPDSVEEKLNNYKKEVIAARGNRAAIQSIKQKYKNENVPIEQVSFSV